jgi:hypothetical protein
MLKKILIAPNGVRAEVHRLRGAEVKFPATALTLIVHSYASELDYYQKGAIVWETQVQRPFTALGAGFFAVLEDWLVTEPTSPFFGATIFQEETGGGIEYARKLKLLELENYAREKMAAVNLAVTQATLTTAVQAIRTQALAARNQILAAASQPELDAILMNW